VSHGYPQASMVGRRDLAPRSLGGVSQARHRGRVIGGVVSSCCVWSA